MTVRENPYVFISGFVCRDVLEEGRLAGLRQSCQAGQRSHRRQDFAVTTTRTRTISTPLNTSWITAGTTCPWLQDAKWTCSGVPSHCFCSNTVQVFAQYCVTHRNTDIIDSCIVFRSWHIHSNAAFVYSCLAIIALSIFYEYLRSLQRKLDYHIALSLSKGKGRNKSNSRGNSGRASPVGSGAIEEIGLLSGHRVLSSSLTGCVASLSAHDPLSKIST